MSETTRRPAPPTGTPAGGTGRLPLLDVLRGVAVLGTLMTNIWIFAGPGAEWGVLTGGLDTPGLFSGTDAAGLAETVFRLLADGKFLALLTVLFGAGLAIQYDAARRRPRPRHPVRRQRPLVGHGAVGGHRPAAGGRRPAVAAVRRPRPAGIPPAPGAAPLSHRPADLGTGRLRNDHTIAGRC